MDTNRIRAIYDEISGYVIELESDPSVLGVKYLNELIARCRNYLNRVSLTLQEIGREKRELSSQLRAEESAFQVSFDELLANDARVRNLPNIADRTSTINMMLRDQRNSIETLKRDLQDLEHVEKAVRHRHNELKATNTDIKMQRQMVRDELDTGAFYGDEGDGVLKTHAVRRTKDDDIDENELASILNGQSIAGNTEVEKDDEAAISAALASVTTEDPPQETSATSAAVSEPSTVEEENAAAIAEAVKAATVVVVETPVVVKTDVLVEAPKTEPSKSVDEIAIEAFLAEPAANAAQDDDDPFKGIDLSAIANL